MCLFSFAVSLPLVVLCFRQARGQVSLWRGLSKTIKLDTPLFTKREPGPLRMRACALVLALHPFHLLTPSAWPLASSVALFNLAVCFTRWLNEAAEGSMQLGLAFLSLALAMGFWWRDISHEAT